VEHGAVDDVGESSFECAHGFHRGLSVDVLAPVVVGASFGLVAQLDGGHGVQDSVDLPVPAAGEPVPDAVAGGGVDRGGSGPGSEVGLGREAGDLGDSG
jgi:hypothetical protein